MMDVQVFIPFTPSPTSHFAPAMSDPKERFFRHFQAEITTIQDQIDVLATMSPIGGERLDCTETVLAGISRLNNEVIDAADYVPAYDQRTYAQALKALTEKLNEATGKFAPKARFQFKPRQSKPASQARDSRVNDPFGTHNGNHNENLPSEPMVAGQANDAVGTLPSFPKNYNEELSRLSGAGSGVRKPSFSAAKHIAIHDQAGLHIMLPSTASRATSSGNLTNLKRCIVDMTIPTSSGAPFAGLALKNIKQSLIVAGHVAGAAHITGLKDTTLVVAARQVRIHECKNVHVYLQCSSHPIIEDCEGMRFAPIPKNYMNSSADAGVNQWDQVDDFKWLKSEPSPNWSVLAEDKRIPESVWTNTVCGSASLSTDDILREVGVLES